RHPRCISPLHFMFVNLHLLAIGWIRTGGRGLGGLRAKSLVDLCVDHLMATNSTVLRQPINVCVCGVCRVWGLYGWVCVCVCVCLCWCVSVRVCMGAGVRGYVCVCMCVCVCVLV